MKFLSHDGLLYFWKKVKNYTDTSLTTAKSYTDTNFANAKAYTDTNIATTKTYVNTSISNIKQVDNANSVSGYTISVLTQAAYNALTTKNSNTIYYIVG